MNSRLLVMVIGLTILGCSSVSPSSSSAISSYNKGVHAYKAKDYAKARIEWSKSISEGDVTAQNNFGYLLFYGLGGDSDRERAIGLWRKAAADGVSESQWHLGVIYERGEGVGQDYVEAYAWYKCSIASAEFGSSDSPGDEEAIANDSRKSLAKLLGRLSKEQFERGEQLSREYISLYVKGRS